MRDDLVIRDYRSQDAKEIADLFHGSVHALEDQGYSPQELEAWAPTPPDYAHWRARLAEKKPFVAELDGRIVGFIELEDDGHIDCFYTHGSYQRRGLGRRLYAHLESEAERRGIDRLYVEASAIARPFFEAAGFVLEKTNHIERNGRVLTNHSMKLERGPGRVRTSQGSE